MIDGFQYLKGACNLLILFVLKCCLVVASDSTDSEGKDLNEVIKADNYLTQIDEKMINAFFLEASPEVVDELDQERVYAEEKLAQAHQKVSRRFPKQRPMMKGALADSFERNDIKIFSQSALFRGK